MRIALAGLVALVTACSSGSVGDGGPSAAPSAGTHRAGDLTVLFGRAIWTAAANCRPLPGAVDLGEVAAGLAEQGRRATTAVVVDRVADRTRRCEGQRALQASWHDLATLRDRYRWSVVSDGLTHDDVTAMPPARQRAETCGSLVPLREHGHDRAWGLYAYGNNRWSDELQQDVVSTCFAFGRRYREGTNDRRRTGPPWFQSTNSVLGGRCNDPTRVCALRAVKNDRVYWLPDRILATLPRRGQWTVWQFYRLVEDHHSTGAQQWDCRGDDARTHWTSQPELYCYEDFRTVIDALPSTVRTVDPATVAEEWDRRPDR